MKNSGKAAAVFGIAVNFALFLAKLYVSISSNSLSIYCDAINNLLDIFSCAAVLLGFFLVAKYSERPAKRTQSLFTFIISIVITVTGAYFLYNGIQRTMYPVPISYSHKYAAVISVTVCVKVLMAIVYHLFNRRQKSKMLSALVLDSILDSCITVFTLLGLFAVRRAGFAIDGIFAIVIGAVITATSVKTLLSEAKFLIND